MAGHCEIWEKTFRKDLKVMVKTLMGNDRVAQMSGNTPCLMARFSYEPLFLKFGEALQGFAAQFIFLILSICAGICSEGRGLEKK